MNIPYSKPYSAVLGLCLRKMVRLRKFLIISLLMTFGFLLYIFLFCSFFWCENVTSCGDVVNCRLPNCLCPGKSTPGGISSKDTPQIVMLSFDDWVNPKRFRYFSQLFQRSRKNPNGCPITATFFVSENGGTNYSLVNSLYKDGHEIASHGISHRYPANWWNNASYVELVKEFVGQRDKIADKANIPKEHIRGIRVPFLEIGKRNQFRMLKNYNFTFDASVLLNSRLTDYEHYWPFTLDSPPPANMCMINECPDEAYPGVWEIPLHPLKREIECGMTDDCREWPNERIVYQYLMYNFNRYYNGNRAPLGFHMHASWFKDNYNFEALDRLVKTLLTLPDVYVVNMYDAIEYFRHPVPLSSIKVFQPWKNNRGCVR